MRQRISILFEYCRKHEQLHFSLDAAILFIGNGIMSLLFLFFHMLTGREMSGLDYAEFVAMIGLLNVLSVPAGVMQLTMARYVARQQAFIEEGSGWLQIMRRGLLNVTRWGGLALVIWWCAAPFLSRILDASSAINVGMVGVIAFVFLYTPILGGALQGRRLFGWFALSGIGVGASRLALIAVALLFTRHVAAALAVVACSYVVGLLVSAWPLRSNMKASPVNALPASGDIHRYFWGVLISQAALFALIHGDVILAPRLLDGDTLAAYQKAATLSRIVFFLPVPIIIAMFPRAVISAKPEILRLPLLLTLLLSVTVAVLFSLWPEWPLRIMYGISDALHLTLMRYYVWAAIPLALISVLSPYLWARRKVAITMAVIPVTIAYIAALLRAATTPHKMMLFVAIGGVITLAMLLAMVWHTMKHPAE